MELQVKCDDCQLGKQQHRTNTINFQREEITEGVTIKVKNRKMENRKAKNRKWEIVRI